VRSGLYIAGAFIEFLGIILVGSPDLFPQARRVSGWIGLGYRRVTNRFWRLIGRPRSKIVSLGLAGEVSTSGSLSAVKVTTSVGTIGQKVDFLLRRDEEAQRHVNELRERIRVLEGKIASGLETARAEMEDHVTHALRTAHEAYLPLRIVGVVALVVGLGLVTAGNFVN
jgi:hypothetical protein